MNPQTIFKNMYSKTSKKKNTRCSFEGVNFIFTGNYYSLKRISANASIILIKIHNEDK